MRITSWTVGVAVCCGRGSKFFPPLNQLIANNTRLEIILKLSRALTKIIKSHLNYMGYKGNGETLRNDNSSHSGKLVEIHFNETEKKSSANIQPFLLEKFRVVQYNEEERSRYIIYQLQCAGAPPSLRGKLYLQYVEDYKYLIQSNCYSIVGVDDAKEFLVLMKAREVGHISKGDPEKVLAGLAVVLWLGNIPINGTANENHVEVVEGKGLIGATKLIGCDIEDLQLTLSTRKMKVGTDIIIRKSTLSPVIDALAKSIYACLIDCLVEQIYPNYLLLAKDALADLSIF